MPSETKEIAPADLAAAVAEKGRGHTQYLYLDFDGTLVDFASDPEKVVVSDAAGTVLRKLSQTSQTIPVIVSGRTRNFLESRFAGIEIDIAAEHGRLFRSRSKVSWEVIPPQIASGDLTGFLPLLEAYTDRVPGSLVERKEFSLTWHYRAAAPGDRALVAELEREILKSMPPDLKLVSGEKVFEICPVSGGKGRFLDWYIDDSGQVSGQTNYFLSVGDDRTDEEMFQSLQLRGGTTVKVGPGETCADFRLPDSKAVAAFLNELATGRGPNRPSSDPGR